MKYRILIAAVLLAGMLVPVSAQAPQQFNYQAVARDDEGNLLVNSPLDVRIGILEGSEQGILLWEEIHQVTTNDQGLFTLRIGDENAVPGGGELSGFSQIPWSEDAFYLKIELDAGSGYTIMGTVPFLSVPYALYSEQSSSTFENLRIQPGEAGSGEPLFQVLRSDGYPVFAVYEDGVYAYTDTAKSTKGVKGGFAVGGYQQNKGIAEEYMRVTPDSIRFYVHQDPAGKGVKGGFAVGGYQIDTKGPGDEFLRVTPDSVRVYINDDPGAKGLKGGFAVGGYQISTKGHAEYFNISGQNQAETIPGENRIVWYPLRNAFLSGKVLVSSVNDVGENSMASGYEPQASGDYSQAFGYRSVASGLNSTAIGYEAEAQQPNAFAFGQWAQATGEDSYAFGRGALAEGFRSFAFGSAGVDSAGQTTGVTRATGDYSFAVGQGSQAKKTGSFAFGLGNTSNGNYSTTIGQNNTTSDYYAIAMGYQSSATGNSAVAMGRDATASDFAAFAMGYEVTASAPAAVAFGRGNTASGWESFAVGTENVASGGCSFAGGRQATASHSESLAFGYKASSSGWASVALGNDVTASGDNSIVLGGNGDSNNKDDCFLFSDGYPASNTTAGQFMARARGGFIFRTDNTVSESVYIEPGTGFVGLGISNPNARLTLDGGINIEGGYPYIEFDNNQNRLTQLNNDMYLSADDDLFLQPDDDIHIGRGSSNYAHFNGGTYSLSLQRSYTKCKLTVDGYTDLKTTYSYSDASGSYGTGVLQIDGDLRLDGDEIITDNYQKLYINCGNSGDVEFDYGTLVVDASADRVGIGTTAPGYPLTVQSSRYLSGVDYGYLNSEGKTGETTGNGYYSIYARRRIRAEEFNADSDVRIKNVIGRSNAEKDLRILEQVRISDYTYVDTILKGTQSHKKIIAQELQEIFPEAVTATTGFVPGIFCRVSGTTFDEQEGALTIRLAREHGLNRGDRVKLIVPGEELVREVIAAGTPNSFTIASNQDHPDMFVYGKEVDDFLTIDYEAVSMLHVSATQELQRIIRGQSRSMEEQQTQLEAYREQAVRQQAQIEAMEAELEELRSMVTILAEE